MILHFFIWIMKRPLFFKVLLMAPEMVPLPSPARCPLKRPTPLLVDRPLLSLGNVQWVGGAGGLQSWGCRSPRMRNESVGVLTL